MAMASRTSGKCLHDPVHLRGPDAHAGNDQGRIGAAVNHISPAGGPLDEVAVVPDAGEAPEIGVAVTLAALVAPEAQGHGGEGPAAHELPLAPFQRTAVVVVHLHRHPHRGPLDFPGEDGSGRQPPDEAGAQVRPARHRSQMHVALHVLVDVAKARRIEGRAGGQHGAKRVQRVARAGARRRGAQRGYEARGGPEVGHPGPIGEVEEDAVAGKRRRAVVQKHRRARSQDGDEPVPHHPSQGREVEHPVARLHVRVQALLLQMLQQHPAGAVDDALGRPRGPRGEQDVERVLEGETGEGDLARLEGLDEVRKIDRAGNTGQRIAVRVRGSFRTAGTDDHHALNRWKPGRDFREPVQGGMPLSPIPVAVDPYQQAWRDLAEAVHHAVHSEVGRCAGGDRPQTRRGEHRRNRLRHVGEQQRHPVASADAGGLHPLDHARHQIPECPPGKGRPRPSLRVRDDGGGGIGSLKQVLGEVEPRAGEIPGVHRSRSRLQNRIALVAHHPAPVPERVPEGPLVRQRPSPQSFVARAGIVSSPDQERAEVGEVRRLAPLPRRFPDGRGHRRSEGIRVREAGIRRGCPERGVAGYLRF